jgi:Na+-translocating ferredoxin:NAD+ oxidoreductase RnfC subunit
MKEYRRVPLMQLRRRLQVDDYEREAPFDRSSWQPAAVRVKLRQHAGQPASPVVAEGKKVKKGQMIGRVEEGKLGANVHASINGKVSAVTADYIEIVA